MKRLNVAWSLAVALLAVPGLLSAQAPTPLPGRAARVKLPFILFGDQAKGDTLPYAPSGWMGKVEAIEFNDCCDFKPREGACCIQINYNDPAEWGGIVWQNPVNNWGNDEGGYDITGARQLSFWARGDTGRETVEFSMGIIGKERVFYDTTKGTTGKVRLGKEWRRYTIPLMGKNLSRIVTGFCVSFAGAGQPITFYLDDIRYE